MTRLALPGRAVQAAGVIVLLAHVVTMWIVGFHSQDGPAHLFAAHALGRLLTDDPGLLASAYAPNLHADPNWITYPLLAFGLRFASPTVVELAVVSLLAVGTAAAMRYVVTARDPRSAPLAVVGFPLAVGWSLHTGLYNFTAAVALMLAIVGHHLRVVDHPTPRRSILLAGLLLVLYFGHPLALVGAFAIIGVSWLAVTGAEVRRTRSPRALGRRFGLLVLACAPSALLLGRFLWQADSVRPRAIPRELWQSLTDTVLLRWSVGVIGRDDGLWAAVIALAVWLTVGVLLAGRVARRDWRRTDALGALPLVIGAGAVALPDRIAGGTLVQPRLGLLAALTLLLWIAVANADAPALPWLATATAAVVVIAMVALLGGRLAAYRQIDRAAREVVAATSAIRPGSLVLGAVASDAPALPSTVPLVHIVDRLAVQADAVPALTLDAGTGYGPIRYQARFDPGPALRGFPRNRVHVETLAPEVFAGIARRYAGITGRGLDHLVLVGYDVQPDEVRRFGAHGFRLVYRTSPTGLVTVFTLPSPHGPRRPS